MFCKKSKRKVFNKGITLISLVITIIVLLILAGISIAMLTGDNGILTQAQNARDKTNKATEEEKIQMAVLGSSLTNNGYSDILNETSFKQELKNQFGSQELDVVANGDGSFIVTVEDTKRKYYINDDKTVINSDNVIEIGTADELNKISQDVKNGNSYQGKAILLTDNIDLQGEEWEPIGYYANENESDPEAESNKPFNGIFDGCGYEVDNFSINTIDKVQGLFGFVNDGRIVNVGVGVNSTITGGTSTASIVGYLYNGSKAYNCYNKANVIGKGKNTGGIAGIITDNCKVENCYNLGNIIGVEAVGGIAGAITHKNAKILNSYNEGKILGEFYIGGIIGTQNPSDIENCEVNSCFNIGQVEATGKNFSGNSNVGGIVGFNLISISNCYNVGEIKGDFSNVGGIIGLNRGVVQNCYNIGNVSGLANGIGGMIGNNNEYYDSTVGITFIGKTGNSYSLEGVSTNLYGANNSIIGSECSFKTSDELKGLSSTLGNKFKEDTEVINDGYPILYWQ